MTDLKSQPTAMPTRKIWAVMIASAVTSIVKVLMMKYAPEFGTAEVYDLIQAALIVGAGYVVKDRG